MHRPRTETDATMNGGMQHKDSIMKQDDTLSDLQARLTALESRYAYQEDWLDTLDRSVAQQEKRLAQLERLNELMQRKIRDQQQALQENDMALPGPEDELPPHY